MNELQPKCSVGLPGVMSLLEKPVQKTARREIAEALIRHMMKMCE